jgi:hypothetical protein
MHHRVIIATILFAGLGGLLSSAHAAEARALQFVQQDLQLGMLTNGQDVSMTFVLTNRSDILCVLCVLSRQ